jgi:hypothetical protein
MLERAHFLDLREAALQSVLATGQSDSRGRAEERNRAEAANGFFARAFLSSLKCDRCDPATGYLAG